MKAGNKVWFQRGNGQWISGTLVRFTDGRWIVLASQLGPWRILPELLLTDETYTKLCLAE